MNIRDWLEEKVLRNGPREACVFEGTTASYRELDENINRVANSLSGLNVGKGDKVAILLPNCLEYLYVWFALAKLGAVAACVNTFFRGEGLQFLLDSCDASYAVVDLDLEKVYSPLRPGLPKIRSTIWFPELPPEGAKECDHSYREIVAHAVSASPRRIALKTGDPWTFLHTSGTTGRPKWCILSHGYYLEQGQTYADFLGYSADDRVFNPLSLYHANPQVYLVIGSLCANATMITARRFSASAFWDQVREFRATIAILHMAPVEFLKKQPQRPNERDHSLRLTFIPDREFMERFSIPVSVGGYGLTEAALVVFQQFRLPLTGKATKMDRIGLLCGKPSSNVEVGILDEEDRPIGPGITGEIAIRPKKPHVIFDGYYGRPDKTIESWRNLWFHTGDLGFFDPDGDLHFVRRASESLNVRGEWVDVVGLEDLLRSHPKVLDVAVVGIPDPAEGKKLKACVQPKEQVAITPEEILDFCQGKIAHFMIPHYLELMDQLPRLGGTEKVAKADLEKAGVTEKTWDREKEGYKIKRS